MKKNGKKSKNKKNQYMPLNQTQQKKNWKWLLLGTMIVIIVVGLSFLIDSSGNKSNTVRMKSQAKQFRTAQHQISCYSQGLFFLNSTHVFQSCGLYHQSYFHIMQYKNGSTGFTLQQTFKSKIPFNKDVFLQGATMFNDKIYLLTWRENIVYVLNSKTFNIQKTLHWKREGWGLTHNKTHLLVSDGSHKIYICDENMTILEQKTIIGNKHQVSLLNELQYINGYLWMNVYYSNKILKVDVETAKIVQQIDCSLIVNHQPKHRSDEVLNGIAFNQIYNTLLLTGKRWKYFYQLELQ